MDFEKLLRRLGACEDAREWAKGKSLAQAWRTCERGDWMLWLAARAEVRRQDVVLAACACARLSLKHVSKREERPRIAIETAEQWARGKATIEEVRIAAYVSAAYAAAYAYASAADAADSRTRVPARCATLVRKQIPLRMIKEALR